MSLQKPPIAPKGGDTDFDRFWSFYPRKVGKQTARKAFTKALKKTSLETMIAALEQHKLTEQWQRDGGQFIPHPTTWLNQARWEDELPTSLPKDHSETRPAPIAVPTGELLPDGTPAVRWVYPEEGVNA